LLGLHFSQDFPFLCADKQHLFLHSLPSAAAFSQQVSFLPSASDALVRNASAQTAIIRVLIVFMCVVFAKIRCRRSGFFQGLRKHTSPPPVGRTNPARLDFTAAGINVQEFWVLGQFLFWVGAKSSRAVSPAVLAHRRGSSVASPHQTGPPLGFVPGSRSSWPRARSRRYPPRHRMSGGISRSACRCSRAIRAFAAP